MSVEEDMREEPSPGKPGWSLPLKLVGVLAVALLLTLLAWATLAAGRGDALVARIAAGERPQAPGFELSVLWPRTETWPRAATPMIDDRTLALGELRGHPTVINFWASWCIPCRDEAPILNASARVHAGEVVFLGVDVQDLRADALAFLREFRTPYVSVRDRGNQTYEDYGLTGVPETYFLSADGRIVTHVPGAVSRTTLEAGIRAAAGRGR